MRPSVHRVLWLLRWVPLSLLYECPRRSFRTSHQRYKKENEYKFDLYVVFEREAREYKSSPFLCYRKNITCVTHEYHKKITRTPTLISTFGYHKYLKHRYGFFVCFCRCCNHRIRCCTSKSLLRIEVVICLLFCRMFYVDFCNALEILLWMWERVYRVYCF